MKDVDIDVEINVGIGLGHGVKVEVGADYFPSVQTWRGCVTPGYIFAHLFLRNELVNTGDANRSYKVGKKVIIWLEGLDLKSTPFSARS